MKTKNIETDNLVQVPESTLVALLFSQLEGKELFTEKIEAAKKLLQNINNNSNNKKVAF